MRDRTVVRLAWVSFGFAALGLVGGLILSALNASAPNADVGEILAGDALWVAMFSFAVAGVLIAARHPRNPVGWILLAIGLIWEVGGALAENYVRYAFITSPGSLPRPDLVAAMTSSIWVPGLGLIGTFLLLLFPDGRLPSAQWRLLAWLCGLVLLVGTIIFPITPGALPDVDDQLSYLPRVTNPLGIEALRPLIGALYGSLVLLPVCIAASALSLIGRLRRSHGRQRLQLKWLAAGAGVTAGIYLVAMVLTLPSGAWITAATPLWLMILQQVATYSFVLIPMAVGIAILRYRLYDIDVIINRALVYGLLSTVLAGVYALCVFGLGAAARAIAGHGSNDVAVAASTLAVASLFGPLRRRVQTFIDRRFYRHKYNAERTLSQFAATLRDKVDLEALNAELTTVVTTTMQPRHVSLWLKSLGR